MIKKLLADLKIAFGVGQEYFYFMRYPVLLAIAIRVYFPNSTILTIGMIALTIVNIFILLGQLDLLFIQFHQAVQERATRNYNPFFNQLERKV